MIHQDGLPGAIINPHDECEICHLLPLPCCNCWAGNTASHNLCPEDVGGMVLYFVCETGPLLNRPKLVGVSRRTTSTFDHLVDRVMPMLCDWSNQQESCDAVSPCWLPTGGGIGFICAHLPGCRTIYLPIRSQTAGRAVVGPGRLLSLDVGEADRHGQLLA